MSRRLSWLVALALLANAASFAAERPASVRLVEVTSASTGSSQSVLITSTEPASYTTRQPDPLTVLITLRDVAAGDVATKLRTTSADPVASVDVLDAVDTDGDPVVQVHIRLREPTVYEVRSRRQTIQVRFARPAAPDPGRAPRAADVAPSVAGHRRAATDILSVETAIEPHAISVTLHGNGVLSPGRIHETEHLPPRLVIEFPNLGSQAAPVTHVEIDPVKQVRVAAESSELTRVVLDLARPALYHVEQVAGDAQVFRVVFPRDSAIDPVARLDSGQGFQRAAAWTPEAPIPDLASGASSTTGPTSQTRQLHLSVLPGAGSNAADAVAVTPLTPVVTAFNVTEAESPVRLTGSAAMGFASSALSRPVPADLPVHVWPEVPQLARAALALAPNAPPLLSPAPGDLPSTMTETVIVPDRAQTPIVAEEPTSQTAPRTTAVAAVVDPIVEASVVEPVEANVAALEVASPADVDPVPEPPAAVVAVVAWTTRAARAPAPAPVVEPVVEPAVVEPVEANVAALEVASPAIVDPVPEPPAAVVAVVARTTRAAPRTPAPAAVVEPSVEPAVIEPIVEAVAEPVAFDASAAQTAPTAGVTPVRLTAVPETPSVAVGAFPTNEQFLSLRGGTGAIVGSQAPQVGTQVLGQPLSGQQEYSGEPISMDFQNIDLRAVLRVFADISGLNLVIDPSVQGEVNVVLTQVPWDQAFAIILRANGLDYEVDGTVVRIASVERLRDEAMARAQLAQSEADAGELVLYTRALSYARAEDLVQLLTSTTLSARGEVFTDARTNTLIIRDLQDRLQAASDLLDTLDQAEPQVEIEARIVQAGHDSARALGVQWGVTGRVSQEIGNTLPFSFPNRGGISGRAGVQGPSEIDSRAQTDENAGTAVNLGVGGATSAIGLTMGAVNGALNLDVILSALESEGELSIISSPRVMTQNNVEAEILQGDQIPYQTVANNTVTVQFKEAALQLRVTPQITASNTVIMQVALENSFPDFARALGNPPIPPIVTQRATTSVQVADGETTVIGGIYENTQTRQNRSTPLLSRIPLLGWMFKSSNNSESTDELMIFLTPRIVR